MASTLLLTLCLGMLAVCLGAPTNTIRWCVKSDPEMKKCKDLSQACSTDKTTLSCVHKGSTDDCIKAIAGGLADAITLDSGDIYKASQNPYNLKPIMAENYGTGKTDGPCSKERLKLLQGGTPAIGRFVPQCDETGNYEPQQCHGSTGYCWCVNANGEKITGTESPPGKPTQNCAPHALDTCYYAVALVKKSSNFMFDGLQGKKSCHTGVGRTAGWVIPTGVLAEKKKINLDDPEEQSAEKAVSQFFSASCAPGAKEESLCKLCIGPKDKKCKQSESEPHFGYAGARKCLIDDKGDVAFVKHIMPEDLNKDYELLCKDNTRKAISEYEQCSWARVPAHAVVSIQDEDKIKLITDFLMEAQTKQDIKLFSSPHGKDLIFKDSCTGLLPLPSKVDAFLYLGKDFTDAYKALHTKAEEPAKDKIRICTQSKEEKQKCDTWTIESEGAIECVEASLAEECVTKIMKGDADAVTLDGGYLYTAGACGLVPAMAEIYNADECKGTGRATGSYYAVAVIKASDKDITWNNLKGTTSCHTAVGRTAGWIIPCGLIHKETGICDMSTFFKSSCAPGADPDSNLCKLCAGDPTKSLDSSKCSANNKELYYSYHGAFRCLLEAGQVAFVKHTTVFEVVGDNPAWLKNKKLDDFRLLCRDGSVKPVSEYKTCHLAEVPSHAVATTPERRDAVVRVLTDQQLKFGKKTDNPAQSFRMFFSEGRRDQLFKDSTECLREVKGEMKDFLGEDYNDAVSSLNSCSKSELLKACTFHTCNIQI